MKKKKPTRYGGSVSLLLAGDYTLNGFRLGVFASHHNSFNDEAQTKILTQRITPLIADRTLFQGIGYRIYVKV
jgi:hypothetical protein